MTAKRTSKAAKVKPRFVWHAAGGYCLVIAPKGYRLRRYERGAILQSRVCMFLEAE